MGYSAEDIISNIFKVCKNHAMDEKLKLKFVKVNCMTSFYVLKNIKIILLLYI